MKDETSHTNFIFKTAISFNLAGVQVEGAPIGKEAAREIGPYLRVQLEKYVYCL